MSLAVLGLAALVYGAAATTEAGPTEGHLAGLALAVGTALGGAGHLVGRRVGPRWMSTVSLVALSTVGGAMATLSSFGLVVVGVAAVYAGLLELPAATAVAAAGVVGVAVAVAMGRPTDSLPGAAVCALLGLLVGSGRRHYLNRARIDAELAVARERSALEHERAELLTERTRIAREVHDVLAHTLSALSVQMNALDSLVEGGADTGETRTAIGRSRRLVVEGLDETRRAVRALREEPVALDARLADLAATAGAVFGLRGQARTLSPAAGTALSRVAQEALTNVRRHAPGARAIVELDFRGPGTLLTVTNDAAGHVRGEARNDAGLGPGFGLQGMRERVELLGGTLRAGPHEGGWRVEAEVPE